MIVNPAAIWGAGNPCQDLPSGASIVAEWNIANTGSATILGKRRGWIFIAVVSGQRQDALKEAARRSTAPGRSKVKVLG